MDLYKKMIFSIETSTSNLSLTLLTNNQVINRVSIQIKNELSEIIIPTIKMFLKNNLITFKNITYLVIGCGPGSFTGIRAVISAAKGIYLSNKHIKILGINSLAGLAMSALNEAKKKKKLNILLLRLTQKEMINFYSCSSLITLMRSFYLFLLSTAFKQLKLKN